MIFALVLAMTLALTFTAFANDEDPVEREVVYVNLGFHCGDGDNGGQRVRPAGYVKGAEEAFLRLDDVRWELESTAYVCPECGKTDWISFSNMSGVPNGKNIQVTHKGGEPPTDSYGQISIAVRKLLTADAQAYYDANPGLALPEFTFTLELLVDGEPYTGDTYTGPLTIAAGENDTWGTFLFDSTVEVTYKVTELSTPGFVQVGVVETGKKNGVDLVELGTVVIEDEDIVAIGYTFTNGFAYGGTDTAAAFSLDRTKTYGPYGKDAWHFVSFNKDEAFEIIAGQWYRVGTGKVIAGEIVIEWAPGVKVIGAMAYAYAPDKQILAQTQPGQLVAKYNSSGKLTGGYGSLDYAAGAFLKIHFQVQIANIVKAGLDIR